MQKREEKRHGIELKKKRVRKKERKEGKYHALSRIKKGNTKAHLSITFRHTCT